MPGGEGGGGRWARLKLTEPLNVESFMEVFCRCLENWVLPYIMGNFELLDYRKCVEELRFSKKQQRIAMHSRFSV